MLRFSNSIPKKVIMDYIDKYEKEEINLCKNKLYYQKKNNLLYNSNISLNHFKTFIDSTKNSPYTKVFFGKDYKKLKAAKSLEICHIDIKFNKCIYYAFPMFTDTTINRILNHLDSNPLHEYLIVDLRNNCGGTLNACVRLCNRLMPESEIVSLSFNEGIKPLYSNKTYRAFKKIYIIVNKHSASSSEIFALSMLLSNKYVSVIGADTYHKNIGQSNYVNNTYCFQLRLSTYTWSVKGKGIDYLTKNIIEVDDHCVLSYIANDIY